MGDKLSFTVNVPSDRLTLACVQWWDEKRQEWLTKGAPEMRLSANGNPWTFRLEPGEGIKVWDAGPLDAS